ncbi:integral membrane protein protein, putative [Babesia ovis]|uniref:Integral membrane protein protein, putative n=1 Tax=Babesia ovis TaxID=5869 RepID=A0A9W5TDN4_BABOV|nr:integral membrane protein protein, putative [Babesia ovis]
MRRVTDSDAICASPSPVDPSQIPDNLKAVIETAKSLIRSYDLLDALTILDSLEQEATSSNAGYLLSICSELQAEVYIYLGDYKKALCCLLRCNASCTTSTLAARIAFNSGDTKLISELSPCLADLLSSYASRPGNVASTLWMDPLIMLVESLCRSGRLYTMQNWLQFVLSQSCHTRRLRSAPSIGPCLRLISAIHRDWLLQDSTTESPTSQSAHLHAGTSPTSKPYATFVPSVTRDKSSPDNLDLVTRLSEALGTSSRQSHQLLFYTKSLWLTLETFAKDMQRNHDSGTTKVIVSMVDCDQAPISVPPLRKSAKIANNIPYRNSKRPKTGKSTIHSVGVYSQRVPLKSAHLSFKRNYLYSRSRLASSQMEFRILAILAKRMQDRESWDLCDISLLFLDVLSRYHRVLELNQPHYVTCLGILFNRICDMLKDYTYTSSSTTIFTSPSVCDSRIIYGSTPRHLLFRKILLRSGVYILSIILSTMQYSVTTLRSCCNNFGINDPLSFMRSVFTRLSSLVVFICNSGFCIYPRHFVLQARVLFVLGKRLIREDFPRRTRIIRRRYRDAYMSLASIVQCLYLLFATSYSATLSCFRTNPHLVLSLRRHGHHVNFHNLRTQRRFNFGTVAIERLWRSLKLFLDSCTLEK